MTQTIQEGVVAAIAYTLTVDKEIIEIIDSNEPVEYLHGAENLVPGLEKALVGRKAGDQFTVTVSPEEGYGEYSDDLIDEVSKEDFENPDDIEVGMELELLDEDDYIEDATVLKVTDDTIILDFNPPLAGKTLHYAVEVIHIREATADEHDMGFPESLMQELVAALDETELND